MWLPLDQITPDTLASLFEALANNANSIVEVHVSNQAQSNMGYRVESRIASAICSNNQLLKVGLRFEFTEVRSRKKNKDRLCSRAAVPEKQEQ